jgi:periplasmic divalent cation tolerance protein
MEAVLVLTTLPDAESATRLARELVESQLAACVNVLAPCRSIYRWKGEVESAEEYPLLIKTSRAGYQALKRAIKASHPYELPEIIAVAIDKGLPEYLQWIGSSVPLTVQPES